MSSPDRPGTARKLILGMAVLGAVLLAVDLMLPSEGPFAIEGWFGFYAAAGALGGIGLVLLARVWRLIAMRREDYYDD